MLEAVELIVQKCEEKIPYREKIEYVQEEIRKLLQDSSEVDKTDEPRCDRTTPPQLDPRRTDSGLHRGCECGE